MKIRATASKDIFFAQQSSYIASKATKPKRLPTK